LSNNIIKKYTIAGNSIVKNNTSDPVFISSYLPSNLAEYFLERFILQFNPIIKDERKTVIVPITKLPFKLNITPVASKPIKKRMKHILNKVEKLASKIFFTNAPKLIIVNIKSIIKVKIKAIRKFGSIEKFNVICRRIKPSPAHYAPPRPFL